jgi:deoxycytidine triphosphate deaminase
MDIQEIQTAPDNGKIGHKNQSIPPNLPMPNAVIHAGHAQTSSQKNAYDHAYNHHLLKHTLAATLVGIILFPFTQSLLPIFTFTLLGYLLARYTSDAAPCDLTDWQIAKLGESVVTPFKPQNVEPDSLDVELGDHYTKVLPDGTTESWVADSLIIAPGECILAHTKESFRFPDNIKGTLQGKSSWARLSLFVECAGLFDKGFRGTAVLELYNASGRKILLKAGDKIAQMSFHRTLPAAIPYGSPLRGNHYQTQQGARESWLNKEGRIIKD